MNRIIAATAIVATVLAAQAQDIEVPLGTFRVPADQVEAVKVWLGVQSKAYAPAQVQVTNTSETVTYDSAVNAEGKTELTPIIKETVTVTTETVNLPVTEKIEDALARVAHEVAVTAIQTSIRRHAEAQAADRAGRVQYVEDVKADAKVPIFP